MGVVRHLGALALVAAVAPGCAHLSRQGPAPRVEIAFANGFVGTDWSLAVYDDGTVIASRLSGPGSRELRVSKTAMRSWLAQSQPSWPTEDVALVGFYDDAEVISVRVRRQSGTTSVVLESPHDFACAEHLQSAFTVWNDLVQVMGKACPDYPCAIACRKPALQNRPSR